jgi:DNA polymerase-3 subunit beta
MMDIQQNNINFASTDTRRLAIVNLEAQNNNELSIIIPKKAIIEIQKLFFDNIEIYYDETNLIIKSNQYLFFTKLINGTFPQYSRIIPKEIKKELILPKLAMIEAIKQITIISTDIKITFCFNCILFDGLSEDNIEAKTEINFITGFEEDFSIAVNSRFLLDFLNLVESSEFKIGLNEPNLPFILSCGNFKTIIMPIVL